MSALLSHTRDPCFLEQWVQPGWVFLDRVDELLFCILVVSLRIEVILHFKASGSLPNPHFSSALASALKLYVLVSRHSHDISLGWGVVIVLFPHPVHVSFNTSKWSLSSFLFLIYFLLCYFLFSLFSSLTSLCPSFLSTQLCWGCF